MAEKFLEIPGVETSCEAVGYEKMLQLEHASFAGFHAPYDASGTGSSGGKVSVGPLSFSAQGGKQSTVFMEKMLTGTHLPTVILHVAVQTGEKGLQTIQTIKFQKVFVTSYQPDFDGDGPGKEHVSMQADIITVDKKDQAADGTLTAVGSVEYDVRKASVA